MRAGKGALDIAGYGVAESPVFVVEGGEVPTHVGSGSWLSAKVNSELPGPIPSLYTINISLLPSTADWSCLSQSSDGPLG